MSEERRLHHDHVSPAIAPRPAPIRHEGYWITLEPVDPARHVADLFKAGSEGERAQAIWEHLPYGPFESEAAFGSWFTGCVASADPMFFAMR